MGRLLSNVLSRSPRDHQIPEWLGAFLFSRLEKSKGAKKYVKRVATGKRRTKKDGSPGGMIYRYYYRTRATHHFAHHHEMKVGSAFAIAHEGEDGHFHVVAVDGDMITVEHDKTKHRSTISRAALAQMMEREHIHEHRKARKAATARLLQANVTGSDKQKASALAHARKYGAPEGVEDGGQQTSEGRAPRPEPETRAKTDLRPGVLDRMREAAQQRGAGQFIGAETETGQETKPETSLQASGTIRDTPKTLLDAFTSGTLSYEEAQKRAKALVEPLNRNARVALAHAKGEMERLRGRNDEYEGARFAPGDTARVPVFTGAGWVQKNGQVLAVRKEPNPAMHGMSRVPLEYRVKVDGHRARWFKESEVFTPHNSAEPPSADTIRAKIASLEKQREEAPNKAEKRRIEREILLASSALSRAEGKADVPTAPVERTPITQKMREAAHRARANHISDRSEHHKRAETTRKAYFAAMKAQVKASKSGTAMERWSADKTLREAKEAHKAAMAPLVDEGKEHKAIKTPHKAIKAAGWTIEGAHLDRTTYTGPDGTKITVNNVEWTQPGKGMTGSGHLKAGPDAVKLHKPDGTTETIPVIPMLDRFDRHSAEQAAARHILAQTTQAPEKKPEAKPEKRRKGGRTKARVPEGWTHSKDNGGRRRWMDPTGKVEIIQRKGGPDGFGDRYTILHNTTVQQDEGPQTGWHEAGGAARFADALEMAKRFSDKEQATDGQQKGEKKVASEPKDTRRRIRTDGEFRALPVGAVIHTAGEGDRGTALHIKTPHGWVGAADGKPHAPNFRPTGRGAAHVVTGPEATHAAIKVADVTQDAVHIPVHDHTEEGAKKIGAILQTPEGRAMLQARVDAMGAKGSLSERMHLNDAKTRITLDIKRPSSSNPFGGGQKAKPEKKAPTTKPDPMVEAQAAKDHAQDLIRRKAAGEAIPDSTMVAAAKRLDSAVRALGGTVPEEAKAKVEQAEARQRAKREGGGKGSRLIHKVESGEHVDGSRADRHALTASSIEAMDDDEATDRIRKAKLSPKLDADHHLARGATPGYLIARKALIGLVASKPKRRHHRTAYVQGLDFLHRSMDQLHTAKDVQAFAKELYLNISGEHTIGEFDSRQEAQKAIDSHKRPTTGNIIRSLPNGKHRALVFHKEENPMRDFYRKITAAMDLDVNALQGWVNFRGRHTKTVLANRERLSTAHRHDNNPLDHPETVKALGDSKIKHKGSPKGPGRADTGRRKKYRFKRATSDSLQREGGRHIGATSSDRMRKEFNLKNVQFGNWLSDEDAKHHLEAAHSAFADLGDVLGLSPEAISQGGKLAIGFGARGSGRAVAHYESDSHIINMTKYLGGGSLAHEWGHFLDHVLHDVAPAPKGRGKGKSKPFLSDAASQGDLTKLHPEVAKAAHKLWGAIRFEGGDNHRHDIERHQAAANESSQWLRLHGWKPGNTDEKRGHQARIRESMEALFVAKDAQRQLQPSAYYQRSHDHCGETKDGVAKDAYYIRPHELFARAFEGYISDKLKASGRRNSYLVDGVDHALYPNGEERERINAAFDGLMSALKSTGTIHKALSTPRLLSRPR